MMMANARSAYDAEALALDNKKSKGYSHYLNASLDGVAVYWVTHELET